MNDSGLKGTYAVGHLQPTLFRTKINIRGSAHKPWKHCFDALGLCHQVRCITLIFPAVSRQWRTTRHANSISLAWLSVASSLEAWMSVIILTLHVSFLEVFQVRITPHVCLKTTFTKAGGDEQTHPCGTSVSMAVWGCSAFCYFCVGAGGDAAPEPELGQDTSRWLWQVKKNKYTTGRGWKVKDRSEEQPVSFTPAVKALVQMGHGEARGDASLLFTPAEEHLAWRVVILLAPGQ